MVTLLTVISLVCVCVCACVRVHVCVCARVCACVCVCDKRLWSYICKWLTLSHKYLWPFVQMDQLVLAHAVQIFLHTFIDTLEMTINTCIVLCGYRHAHSSGYWQFNLQISLASVSCQYPELTINTILERIWKTKCDLFRLKFDAIIVKFVAMQI